MLKKELFIVLMIISMFLISACDVYETLYVKESEVEEAVEVPEEVIVIEIEEDAEASLGDLDKTEGVKE